VSTDNTESVSDFFEEGPFQTDKRIGTQGREDAYRRFMNKISIGAEGAIATTVLPTAIKGFLKGTTSLAAARIPLGGDRSTSIAEAAAFVPKKGIIDPISRGLTESIERFRVDESTGRLDAIVGKVASTLTYQGLLDPVTAKMRSLISPAIEGDVKIAERKLRNIDEAIEKELRKPEIRELTGNQKVRLMNNFMDVLEGMKFEKFNTSPSNVMSRELFDQFKAAKDTIDDLSKKWKTQVLLKIYQIL
jgi:hypothetical protein